MRINNVDMYCSCDNFVANLALNDPRALNPYILRSVVGLDADEIFTSFYGSGFDSGKRFYTMAIPQREIVPLITLNPDYEAGETPSSLRDRLYRAISTSRSGIITLKFKYNDTVVAQIEGLITKLESGLFNEKPEVQITLQTIDPMLRAPEPVDVDVVGLNPDAFVVTDDLSTAPHGVNFSVRFITQQLTFQMSDNAQNPEWAFALIGTNINGINNFQEDDVLHFSSEPNNRYVYINRAGEDFHIVDKISTNSMWPVMFPGDNNFHIPTDVEVLSFSYTPTYWGV